MNVADQTSVREKGSLIVRVQEGLGNRLSALLSAMVIAETLECRLEIVWRHHDNECFRNFFGLFDSVGIERVIFRTEESEGDWLDARKISGAEIRRLIERGDEVCLRACTIFGFDLREGWTFFEAVREKLRRFQPVAEVRALIGSVPPSAIGMHIRFTDHFPCHAFTPRWCYRSAVKILGARFPGVAIFICSDTPACVEELRKDSTVKVITSPGDKVAAQAPRNSLEGSRAALTDLWLLSRSAVLLSAPMSSFATTAQNLGGGLAYFLSRVADPAKFRRTQFAWRIHAHIQRDATRQDWTIRDRSRKNIIQASVSLFFLVWAKLVCSRIYQDHPLPFTRRRFEKRFTQFLNSADCRRALAHAKI